MTRPAWRDRLFSIKTFAAAMLAVCIGLPTSLPRPYRAMATVYLGNPSHDDIGPDHIIPDRNHPVFDEHAIDFVIDDPVGAEDR